MHIEMPKGDYRPFKFKIKNKDTTDFNQDVDEIYITFKRNRNEKDFLFQKRLSIGDITKDEEGYYHFSILPEDTDKLSYAKYVFDIEICNENPKIKQTKTGTLQLTDEVTHTENEVV